MAKQCSQKTCLPRFRGSPIKGISSTSGSMIIELIDPEGRRSNSLYLRSIKIQRGRTQH